ncbi:hypothetical protein [Nonomuraea fuscirosea]|uniref:hypothetical protein n=1 Tax=Nonomuraea fuscirosea TaxID=1291556 RepID=UPI0033DF385B
MALIGALDGLAVDAHRVERGTVGEGHVAGAVAAERQVVRRLVAQVDHVVPEPAVTVSLVMPESGTDALRINDSVSIVPGPGCVQAPGDATTVRCSGKPPLITRTEADEVPAEAPACAWAVTGVAARAAAARPPIRGRAKRCACAWFLLKEWVDR